MRSSPGPHPASATATTTSSSTTASTSPAGAPRAITSASRSKRPQRLPAPSLRPWWVPRSASRGRLGRLGVGPKRTGRHVGPGPVGRRDRRWGRGRPRVAWSLPALASVAIMTTTFREDDDLPEAERRARAAARMGAVAGGIAGSMASVAAVKSVRRADERPPAPASPARPGPAALRDPPGAPAVQRSPSARPPTGPLAPCTATTVRWQRPGRAAGAARGSCRAASPDGRLPGARRLVGAVEADQCQEPGGCSTRPGRASTVHAGSPRSPWDGGAMGVPVAEVRQTLELKFALRLKDKLELTSLQPLAHAGDAGLAAGPGGRGRHRPCR